MKSRKPHSSPDRAYSSDSDSILSRTNSARSSQSTNPTSADESDCNRQQKPVKTESSNINVRLANAESVVAEFQVMFNQFKL